MWNKRIPFKRLINAAVNQAQSAFSASRIKPNAMRPALNFSMPKAHFSTRSSSSAMLTTLQQPAASLHSYYNHPDLPDFFVIQNKSSYARHVFITEMRRAFPHKKLFRC